MPGRTSAANNSSYRYGFNGKEMDNETYGSGNEYDYGMRIYNPRIGKFLSVDPLIKKYANLTPYQFASNSPISGVDLDGLEYYYASDGTLLGRAGTSIEVRLVNDDYAAKHRTNFRVAVPEANENSHDVGMSNEELNQRAFLSTFRSAENYSAGKPTEYNALYGQKKDGGGTFTDKTYEEAPQDYADHPRKFVKSWGNPVAMSAAGAYQITEITWDEFKKKAGVTDFSPMSQDKTALAIMRSAAAAINNGDVTTAMTKLNGRWSSLPGGKYQQITLEQAAKLFQEYLKKELNSQSIIATPKGQLSPPPPTTTSSPSTESPAPSTVAPAPEKPASSQ